MQCFHHHNKPAIGICRGCSKGLCDTCRDTNEKLMVCAQDIECHKQLQYSRDAQARMNIITPMLNESRHMMKIAPYMWLLFSLCFWAMSFYEYINFERVNSVVILCAIFGSMFAVAFLLTRFKRQNR